MSTPDPTRLATAIAAACADAPLLAELDSVLERGGRSDALPFRWDAGGCLILAEAIRRVAGGGLVGAFEEGIDGEADESTLDHVLVELADDCYADAFGVHDLDATFDTVVEVGGFESPVLLALAGHDDPRAESIIYDEALTTRLAARLQTELAA
jgi:hypothetical protein